MICFKEPVPVGSDSGCYACTSQAKDCDVYGSCIHALQKAHGHLTHSYQLHVSSLNIWHQTDVYIIMFNLDILQEM